VTVSNDKSIRLPRVIGHRGAAATAPENTLAGIRQAAKLGAAWVEFDVKLTKDGHPILQHDRRLERTTDGRGEVAATTLKDLRRLDAGSWFSPAFRGEPIPTFEEALAVCVELGLGVNVEIKPCPGREVETARVAVERLLEVWPATAPAPLISSFAPQCLTVARAIAPDLPRGYLSGPLPRRWRDCLADHGCAALHLDQRRLRRHQLAELKAAGAVLVAYTVNDTARARALVAAGVTSIITDRVAEVVAALA
jgi:glycerophosphoryl diester phosphodiesterase